MSGRIYATGKDFGEKFIQSLGLPKHTKGFILRCYVGEVVSVTAEYYPEIDGVMQAVTSFRDYEVSKKEGTTIKK